MNGVPVDLTTALLAWGDGRRADLPWRATRDPWAVLVSETMLQQTQTSRVAPRYTAFLARFPTAAACAAAPAADILRAWAGLGYNRRALSLHRAAQAIVERHAGQVPDDLEALLALPGVGPYTARAVLALAFEADHGVLDTNAARVLARAL
ncbi:MAG: A/G-specific adenine glycosylase, partial [Actinomycetota bacterium]|nr:A/G-specific adenine glycosylase [Actinomycetota bacterium]